MGYYGWYPGYFDCVPVLPPLRHVYRQKPLSLARIRQLWPEVAAVAAVAARARARLFPQIADIGKLLKYHNGQTLDTCFRPLILPECLQLASRYQQTAHASF